ncbi:MAG TPA: hypothetical protein VGR82_11390 [Methylomirabilota bacterium]|jgi:hypothetical protein|nr:hypothetical protein [Methylomirabilota bacterium]HEV8617258.1 hypothetical protein [Methylomirabilota bacterium]
MKTLAATVVPVLLLAACATPMYWTKPGATRTVLVDDTEACYRIALLSTDSPSALAREAGSTSGLRMPLSAPPPELWNRAPREVGFERFDERLRYEKCMTDLGYRPTRPAPVS